MQSSNKWLSFTMSSTQVVEKINRLAETGHKNEDSTFRGGELYMCKNSRPQGVLRSFSAFRRERGGTL